MMNSNFEDLLVMKIPAYYAVDDIINLQRIRPDILVFDNDYKSHIDNFKLPDSIIYLGFGDEFNRPLNNVVLPKYLKKIKFGNNFAQNLDYIRLPKYLEVLEFTNYQTPLVNTKLPNGLQELILNRKKDKYNNAYLNFFSAKEVLIPLILPERLEKLVLCDEFDYGLSPFIVPEKLKYLKINGQEQNKPLIDKLPPTLKELYITQSLFFELTELPDSLEELTIDIPAVKKNSYFGNNIVYDKDSSEYVNIEEQNRLPLYLKKINLSYSFILDKIKKIPFGCKVFIMNEDPN